MGRKRKYLTEEEKLNARRERQMRYYWKTVNKQRKKSLERYYENKRNLQNNKQS
jgi:hypothetical protein